MTEMATIDWFGRWGTSVFSENTAIVLMVNGFADIYKDNRRTHLRTQCQIEEVSSPRG